MLVHIKQIINIKNRGKFAVGAFNVNNLETLQAVLEGAEKTKSPVIIQITESAIKYAGLEQLVCLVKTSADEIKAPVALHLDHGKNFEVIVEAIKHGFSSVMLDGSALPYKKNILVTKKTVAFAHARGAWVQGEIGRLEGYEDWVKVGAKEKFLTETADAVSFVKKTGVDALAIAIGNVHGVEKLVKKIKPKLELKRLEEIAKVIKTPLVLHGASATQGAELRRAIELGIQIVNIDSLLRYSFVRGIKKYLSGHRGDYSPRNVLGFAKDVTVDAVVKKINELGSGK